MSNIANVLLYVNRPEEDPAAVALAARTARRHDARLTIVDVVVEAGWMESARLAPRLREIVQAARRQRLDLLAERARKEAPGLEVAATLLAGESAWLPLVAEVVRGRYDLVMKAASGDRFAGRSSARRPSTSSASARRPSTPSDTRRAACRSASSSRSTRAMGTAGGAPSPARC